jgi:hypothetical protein
VVDDAEEEVVTADDSDEALTELPELLGASDDGEDNDVSVNSGVPDNVCDVDKTDVTKVAEEVDEGVVSGGGAGAAPMTGPCGNGERFLIRRLMLP